MDTDKKAELKRYNSGISILRVVLSFLIVLCHFYYAQGLLGFLMIAAVPSFMFLSFYLIYPLLKQKNNSKFIQRIERFLIPHFFWGGGYFIIMSCIENRLLIRELKWQIFAGSVLNSSQWFLMNQIIITGILFGVFKICRQPINRKIMLCLIFGICIVLQYSGVNYAVFIRFPKEASAAYGRICEMIPVACLGIAYAAYRNKILALYKKIVLYGTAIFTFLVGYYFSAYRPKGFTYQGIPVLIASVALCIAFIELPGFHNLIGNLINQLSKYTLGIYCVHILTGNLLKAALENRNITFYIQILFPVLIWISSMALSVGISFIPIKLLKRTVM